MVSQMISWSDGGFVSRSVCRSVARSVSCLVGRSVGSSVGQLIDMAKIYLLLFFFCVCQFVFMSNEYFHFIPASELASRVISHIPKLITKVGPGKISFLTNATTIKLDIYAYCKIYKFLRPYKVLLVIFHIFSHPLYLPPYSPSYLSANILLLIQRIWR